MRKELKTDYNYKTHSDCEVVIPLVCPIQKKKKQSVPDLSILKERIANWMMDDG